MKGCYWNIKSYHDSQRNVPPNTGSWGVIKAQSCVPKEEWVNRKKRKRERDKGRRNSPLFTTLLFRLSQVALVVKKPPAKTEDSFLGQEDPLEKGKAMHSSILGLPL